MADAKCCGEFYTKNSVTWNKIGAICNRLDIHDRRNDHIVQFDLCDQCWEDLITFLKNDKKKE